jgi:hypothetical protein
VNATDSPARLVGAVLTLVMIELTIATAYIHLSLGGTIFLLNGIGYLVLAAGVAATEPPIPFLQRLRWLPRICLATFALVTIGAYLVIGPYFLIGWITKAIEIAIIGLVVADLVNTYRIPGRLVRPPMAPLEGSTGPAPG